ncbi:flagellar hook assembly protein FlgD [Bacteriovoracaceae bacterium]|nr:flagellar hook assembly protein FlgD [Bacteriovoracaceae bacterium]
MPTIGAPQRSQNNSFNQVSIQRDENNRLDPNDKAALEQRKKNIEKVVGGQTEQVYKKGPHNQIGKDEFLKLLSHQLQNQDPMNPMDQNKFSAELAQFSQLEQLTKLNTKFDNLGINAGTETKFMAASFLGKEVMINKATLELKDDGAKADVNATLSKRAMKVNVKIFDEKNAMVGEFWEENIGKGMQTFTWDGKRIDKQEAAKGNYTTQIRAYDDFGEEIKVQTKAKGIVEKVFFENGETILVVDGKKVFLRDVDSFNLPKENKLDVKKMKAQLPNMLNNQEVKQSNQNLPPAKKSMMPLQSKKGNVPVQGMMNKYQKQNMPLDKKGMM